jgi:phosphoribosylaminoimidazole-succinocarboxamide synthase
MSAVAATRLLESLPLIRQGKVRDCYQLGDDLLFVASDRISAFDVILPSAIPGKGAVLNQLSGFWFGKTKHIIPNHLIQVGVPAEVETTDREWFDARSTVARKADRIDFECVVRGYLAGSGWREYQSTGSITGYQLPAQLPRAAQLPEPIFTPAMKNDVGHDENISVERLQDLVGIDVASRLESISLALYGFASDLAAKSGLILADTKFEFGMIGDQLTLIDELLTPDSSRYWEAATWEPGHEPDSFDKQYVRNWLDASGWNHEPPAPELPDDVIRGTQRRYIEAFQRLTGRDPVY